MPQCTLQRKGSAADLGAKVSQRRMGWNWGIHSNMHTFVFMITIIMVLLTELEAFRRILIVSAATDDPISSPFTLAYTYNKTLGMKSYSEARAICSTAGTSLPIVENQEKNTKLMNFISSMNFTGLNGAVFLNAGVSTDCGSLASEGKCYIFRINRDESQANIAVLNRTGMRGCTAITGEYSNFMKDEPTIVSSCVLFNMDGTWQGADKNTRVMNVICEVPPVNPTAQIASKSTEPLWIIGAVLGPVIGIVIIVVIVLCVLSWFGMADFSRGHKEDERAEFESVQPHSEHCASETDMRGGTRRERDGDARQTRTLPPYSGQEEMGKTVPTIGQSKMGRTVVSAAARSDFQSDSDEDQLNIYNDVIECDLRYSARTALCTTRYNDYFYKCFPHTIVFCILNRFERNTHRHMRMRIPLRRVTENIMTRRRGSNAAVLENSRLSPRLDEGLNLYPIMNLVLLRMFNLPFTRDDMDTLLREAANGNLFRNYIQFYHWVKRAIYEEFNEPQNVLTDFEEMDVSEASSCDTFSDVNSSSGDNYRRCDAPHQVMNFRNYNMYREQETRPDIQTFECVNAVPRATGVYWEARTGVADAFSAVLTLRTRFKEMQNLRQTIVDAFDKNPGADKKTVKLIEENDLLKRFIRRVLDRRELRREDYSILGRGKLSKALNTLLDKLDRQIEKMVSRGVFENDLRLH